MDFNTDNIIWAIIIVIVVLMAIVGYIADKTDFGRKQFEKKLKTDKPKKDKVKKEKPNKVEEDIVPMPIETDNVSDVGVVNGDNQMNYTDLSFSDINSQDLVQSDNFPSAEDEIQLENVDSFDLNQGVDDVANESLGNESIDQSLFEPLPSIDQVFSTNTSVEGDVSNNQPIQSDAVENNNQSEVQSDDDIWKF